MSETREIIALICVSSGVGSQRDSLPPGIYSHQHNEQDTSGRR